MLPVATAVASYQLETAAEPILPSPTETATPSKGDELFEIVRYDIVDSLPGDNAVDAMPGMEDNTSVASGSRIKVKL